MDSTSQVFAHQPGVIREISNFFESVDVITLYGSEDVTELGPDVRLHRLRWDKIQRRTLKIWVLITTFLRILKSINHKDLIVFSHMTDLPSAIISPITRLLGIPHVLWYAHSSHSIYLRLASRFVDIILTSTPGSCPYKGEKLRIVGQMVDEKYFSTSGKREHRSIKRVLTVGRIDPSKQIETIVEAFLSVHPRIPNSKLYLVGAPTPKHYGYLEYLHQRYAKQIAAEIIIFVGIQNKQEIRSWYEHSDVFLHGFQGSLDKTLIEAVLMNLSVISSNQEFQDIFPSYPGEDYSLELKIRHNSLREQFEEFLDTSPPTVLKVNRQRQILALNGHSLSHWLNEFKLIVETL